MNATIQTMPAMRAAVVPHTGPYHEIGAAFARLGQLAGPAGLFAAAQGMIGIYLDDPALVPAAELRSEAGLILAGDRVVAPPLGVRSIPSGRYAMAVHRGSYAGLPGVWQRLRTEWLPSSGEQVGEGLSYEIYRNDPSNTPREDLLTEVYLPLAG